MKSIKILVAVFSLIGSQSAISQIDYDFYGGTQASYEIVIGWQTSSELNMNFFEIERSLDGVNFTSIGTVISSVNSNTPEIYSFSDIGPFLDDCYAYKLKSVHLDGGFETTEIFEVCYNSAIASINDQTLANSIVFPNPINTDLLQVECENVSNCSINIANQAGQLCTHFEWTTSNNQLDISHLENGLYHLVFEFATGEIVTKKLVVQ